jgi:FMN phosphatase YigB (HAD superfamily)
MHELVRACVFDAYGTLLDIRSAVSRKVEAIAGQKFRLPGTVGDSDLLKSYIKPGDVDLSPTAEEEATWNMAPAAIPRGLLCFALR